MSNVTITKSEGPKERLFDNEYREDFNKTVNANYKPLCSGIDDFDELLGGGFYPDLYVLAAPTGNGKTTLAMQIAANVAEHGQPVVYAALEMSRKELQSKHIVRIMHKLNELGDYELSGEIPPAQKALYGAWKDEPLFKDACEEYFTKIAPNICTIESVADTSVNVIKDKANKVLEARSKVPLIIVDYLQVMPKEDLYASERQTIDRNVLELKRLSRSMECTVLVLSSMSRQAIKEIRESLEDGNGKPVISEGCCKDSGTIEYTAGTLLGMYVMDYDAYIAVLKSRYGDKTEPDEPGMLSFNGAGSVFGDQGEYKDPTEHSTGVGTKRK